MARWGLPGLSGTAGAAGARPGIESVADVDTRPAPGTVAITCVDYSPDRVQTESAPDIETLLAGERPEWSRVRWVNVDGLHPHVVHAVMQAFDLHTLAAEDVLRVPQRSKLERFETELFVVMRMLMVEGGKLDAEQVSFFYRPDLLITFQERPGDVWAGVRERLEQPQTRLRKQDAAFLLYSLIDAIIDNCFPILEHYGDRLEEIEESVVEQPDPESLNALHGIKRELAQLRRIMWPMRETTSQLRDPELRSISAMARTYLSDAADHATQVVDIVETYRELASSLTDLYMSSISNRMNEVMKVLTIMASLFIPITFIAGVFGMNFDHFPELHFPWMYPWGFWVACAAAVVGLLIYFRHKGWIG